MLRWRSGGTRSWQVVQQRWPMAVGAGSPAGRRSSSLSWRRSRPRSVRRTQNSGCGGKKGRSTRLRGPRADPQRGSAPGPAVLRPAWHPPCELVPLEERRKNASRVLAGSRRRCPGASCRQLRRNLRRLGAPQELWALLHADGYQVSMSSVARALARRGLLLPQRYQAERRQLARARRAVFLEPPTRRCRVWQSDFSEFETIGGGIWRLCGVVDYVAKVSLACPVTTTQTAVDAIAAATTLAAAVDCHQTVYNDVRPHEAIAFRTPLSAWRDFDCPTSSNLFTPETVSLS